MPININPQPGSLSIQKNLAASGKAMSQALERLSSGQRINQSADDAAGQAIAANLDAQLRGLEQATRNTQDGVSLVQTADAAIGRQTDMLLRMRELTVQAGSDILSPQARGAIQAEIDQLGAEIGRVADTTNFNGKNLLDGSLNGQALQVGADAGQTIEVNVGDTRPAATGIDALDVTTAAGAQDALATIDNALGTLGETRAQLGSLQNRLETTIENLGAAAENTAASHSRIVDADFAREVSDQLRAQILEQVGIATLGQANVSAQAALSLLHT
jgi:flagellin